MESYQKTNWVNGSQPAINAANLNKIEQGIYDNRELILGLSAEVDDLEEDIVFQVSRSGAGSAEVVDLVPLTEGSIYIDGTKIKIDYPTSAVSNNRQIINGYTLMNALRQFIPNFNSSRVQTLGHDSAGNISWRNV